MDAEKREQGVGTVLLNIFFPGGLHADEQTKWDELKKIREDLKEARKEANQARETEALDRLKHFWIKVKEARKKQAKEEDKRHHTEGGRAKIQPVPDANLEKPSLRGKLMSWRCTGDVEKHNDVSELVYHTS